MLLQQYNLKGLGYGRGLWGILVHISKDPVSTKENATDLQADPHLYLGMPSSKPPRTVSRGMLLRLLVFDEHDCPQTWQQIHLGRPI